MPEGYTVHRLIPLFKDWNEVLQHRAEITDGKYAPGDTIRLTLVDGKIAFEKATKKKSKKEENADAADEQPQEVQQ